MKIKVEFEIDLEYMEEWCQTKFTPEEVEEIKDYLNHVDERVVYILRAFINQELR